MVWLLPLSLFFPQAQVYELETPYELRRQLQQAAPLTSPAREGRR